MNKFISLNICKFDRELVKIKQPANNNFLAVKPCGTFSISIIQLPSS